MLLGMSGGIDSSVAAMLLQEKGYEVIGITFVFSNDVNGLQKSQLESKKLAKRLAIKHIIADVRKEFEQIVEDYFISEYSMGNTPFPCAVCNPKIKFKYLKYYALENNCDYISTGHYAQIKTFNNRKYICKGVDPEKDQSFFLWGLNSEIVSKLIFPLGSYTKIAIRDYARHNGFVTLSKKKDSLGVCFIEEKDYRNYLKKKGLNEEEGNFVNTRGKAIGRHKGIFHYTVGQRKGLGIQSNKPLFVTELCSTNNEVIVGDFRDLYKKIIYINNYYFIDKQEVKRERTYIVKVRYRLQNTPCTITLKNNNIVKIKLLEPLAMVAKGQTAVIYDNDRVIGGGFILAAE